MLTLLLKTDQSKPVDTSFKHPFASVPTNSKREIVTAFCKKYPWVVDVDFLQANQIDISMGIKLCPKIENLMNKSSWYALHEELNLEIPNNKFYPTHYWERLADLYRQDVTANHHFVSLMTRHGFKFTNGVIESLLSTSLLETVTKQIVFVKIYKDKEMMMLELT